MPINEYSTSAELFEAAKAALLREVEAARTNRPTFETDPSLIWGVAREFPSGESMEAGIWYRSPAAAVRLAERSVEKYHPGSVLFWTGDACGASGHAGQWRVYSRTLLDE